MRWMNWLFLISAIGLVASLPDEAVSSTSGNDAEPLANATDTSFRNNNGNIDISRVAAIYGTLASQCGGNPACTSLCKLASNTFSGVVAQYQKEAPGHARQMQVQQIKDSLSGRTSLCLQQFKNGSYGSDLPPAGQALIEASMALEAGQWPAEQPQVGQSLAEKSAQQPAGVKKIQPAVTVERPPTYKVPKRQLAQTVHGSANAPIDSEQAYQTLLAREHITRELTDSIAHIDSALIYFRAAARSAEYQLRNADALEVLRSSSAGLERAQVQRRSARLIDLEKCLQAPELFKTFGHDPSKADATTFEFAITASRSCMQLSNTLGLPHAANYLSIVKSIENPETVIAENERAAQRRPSKKMTREQLIARLEQQLAQMDQQASKVLAANQTQLVQQQFGGWSYINWVHAASLAELLNTMAGEYAGLGARFNSDDILVRAEKRFEQITGVPYSQRAQEYQRRNALAQQAKHQELAAEMAAKDKASAALASRPLPAAPYDFSMEEVDIMFLHGVAAGGPHCMAGYRPDQFPLRYATAIACAKSAGGKLTAFADAYEQAYLAR